MASNIIVLAPNGRRQTVKVTPNTTILQILEEVCKKQGFKVDEYDVKHHNKILDVSSIIRFSGLPNNAQLEMCTIQKMRADNPVILGVQLESGTRLTGNYIPNNNLWEVLTQLCPDELKTEKNAVVIYMRQEIYGETALRNTSLKSLGLTGGRAMLRLIHRNPEELKTQANVSAPLPSKPQEEKPERPFVRKMQKIDPEPLKEVHTEAAKPTELRIDHSLKNENKSTNFLTDFIKKEKVKKSNDNTKYKNSKNVEQTVKEKIEEPKEEFAFLGTRSAVAFSLDMAQTVPHEELPDEFFELTLKDARKLLRDLKQKRIELEETPLQTLSLKKLEENKKVLRTLHQYKKSIIRIQFPDRTVLQGSFKPIETINDVKKFVKDYLEIPTNDFHLYTTPPKAILNPETSLLDANCVPSIILHFSLDIPAEENYTYLKKDLFSKFISPSLASLAAARSRGNEPKLKSNESDENITMEIDDYVPNKAAIDYEVNMGASTSDKPGTSYSQADKVSESQEKVPKWFKPTNK